jgi:hypothetical protein
MNETSEMTRQARRLILDTVAGLHREADLAAEAGERELGRDITAVANAILNAARVRGLIPRD